MGIFAGECFCGLFARIFGIGGLKIGFITIVLGFIGLFGSSLDLRGLKEVIFVESCVFLSKVTEFILKLSCIEKILQIKKLFSLIDQYFLYLSLIKHG